MLNESSHEVLQIPVHFFPSKNPQKPLPKSNNSAALKIQSLFRGFLVRKRVKKILSIRNQVSEIENNIKNANFIELIGKDVKERLKVNERLMLLLLKLDSVRGVGYGVRELRKCVIRKVIGLQEFVDLIVGEDMVRSGKTVEISCGIVTKWVNDTDSVNVVDSVRSVKTVEISCGIVTERVNDMDSVNVVESVRSGKTVEIESGVVSEQIRDTDCVRNVDGLFDVTVEDVKEIDVNCDSVEVSDEGMNDRTISVQLLEKLMDDNEKMTTLMTQMFERDEMQTRMINSLSRRVEQLEKGYKPRKKKKKMMMMMMMVRSA